MCPKPNFRQALLSRRHWCRSRCRWDQDCPNFQKCCRVGLRCMSCVNPAPARTCANVVSHSCFDHHIIRIFQLSNIVHQPYQSVQCVCVCVCVLSRRVGVLQISIIIITIISLWVVVATFPRLTHFRVMRQMQLYIDKCIP